MERSRIPSVWILMRLHKLQLCLSHLQRWNSEIHPKWLRGCQRELFLFPLFPGREIKTKRMSESTCTPGIGLTVSGNQPRVSYHNRCLTHTTCLSHSQRPKVRWTAAFKHSCLLSERIKFSSCVFLLERDIKSNAHLHTQCWNTENSPGCNLTPYFTPYFMWTELLFVPTLNIIFYPKLSDLNHRYSLWGEKLLSDINIAHLRSDSEEDTYLSYRLLRKCKVQLLIVYQD